MDNPAVRNGTTPTRPLQRRRRPARREFLCAHCGYGAVASIAPERCPMCGGSAWELVQLVAPPSYR